MTRGATGRARDRALNRFMARLFDKGLDRLNEVRAQNGLAPAGSVLENFERADRLLLMTSRAFEYAQFTPEFGAIVHDLRQHISHARAKAA